jgi:hypothetical protein
MRGAQSPQAILAHLRVAQVQPTQVETRGDPRRKGIPDRRPAQAQFLDRAHGREQRVELGLADARKFEREVYHLLAQAWRAHEVGTAQADRGHLPGKSPVQEEVPGRGQLQPIESRQALDPAPKSPRACGRRHHQEIAQRAQHRSIADIQGRGFERAYVQGVQERKSRQAAQAWTANARRRKGEHLQVGECRQLGDRRIVEGLAAQLQGPNPVRVSGRERELIALPGLHGIMDAEALTLDVAARQARAQDVKRRIAFLQVIEEPVFGGEASAGERPDQRGRPGGADHGEVDPFRHQAVAPECRKRAGLVQVRHGTLPAGVAVLREQALARMQRIAVIRGVELEAKPQLRRQLLLEKGLREIARPVRGASEAIGEGLPVHAVEIPGSRRKSKCPGNAAQSQLSLPRGAAQPFPSPERASPRNKINGLRLPLAGLAGRISASSGH